MAKGTDGREVFEVHHAGSAGEEDRNGSAMRDKKSEKPRGNYVATPTRPPSDASHRHPRHWGVAKKCGNAQLGGSKDAVENTRTGSRSYGKEDGGAMEGITEGN